MASEKFAAALPAADAATHEYRPPSAATTAASEMRSPDTPRGDPSWGRGVIGD